jgi:2'-phosphotransferase
LNIFKNYLKSDSYSEIMQSHKILLSRELTSLLRHQAPKKGIDYDRYGGIPIDTIVSLKDFTKYNIASNHIRYIVSSCPKKRFAIYSDDEGIERVCATQGHSYKVQLFGSKLITESTLQKLHINPHTIVHGTYNETLPSILESGGLSKMGRTHIHFAIDVPESHLVISGMRKSCDILIFIDIYTALRDGYEFVLSQNKVVLTTGNKKGILPSKYFRDIVVREK